MAVSLRGEPAQRDGGSREVTPPHTHPHGGAPAPNLLLQAAEGLRLGFRRRMEQLLCLCCLIRLVGWVWVWS